MKKFFGFAIAALLTTQVALAQRTTTHSAQVNNLNNFAAIAGVSATSVADALSSVEKQNPQAIANLSQALERYQKAEKDKKEAIAGLDNKLVKQALVGMLVGVIELENMKKQAGSLNYQNLQAALENLLTGSATQFLASGTAEGWSAESIKGLAEFLSVFANAKATRTQNLTDSFIKASEAWMNKLNSKRSESQKYTNVDAFFADLAKRCGRG